MAFYQDDPRDLLLKRRNELLEEAYKAQREGKSQEYSKLSHDAEAVWQSIEEWESEQGHS